MGKFINEINGKKLPDFRKAAFIAQNIPGTLAIPQPGGLVENLVCVVHNPEFEAAGYIYDDAELRLAIGVDDDREKTWLIVPNVKQHAENE